MKSLLFCLVISPLLCVAQSFELKNSQSGILSLGIRTTASAFNEHVDEQSGLGIGGQFRIQLADRVNTEWFLDYITSSIGDYAFRSDYHIGWSVLYYLNDSAFPLFKPYILAGHCFDYSLLQENRNTNNSIERWSSAVQAGIGTHVRLHDRLDLSLMSQYMIHLGNHISAHSHNGVIEFHHEKGASLEGHLLFTVGINYKIADLW